MDHDEVLVEEEFNDHDLEKPARKRKDNPHTLYSASRSELMRRDPKSVTTEMRNNLEPGHNLSETGRKGTVILHKLGACHAIPQLDYLKFRYSGPAVPPHCQYHQVCKLCARMTLWTEPQEPQVIR